MTEQQKHLQSAITQQKKLIAEINELNDTVSIKKETLIKYQGVIEYLIEIGIKLPETEIETENSNIEPKENN